MSKTNITDTFNMNDIITLKYFYGYNADIKNNLISLTDSNLNTKKIMYTAGNFLITYNLITKEQFYINGNENCNKFSLIQLSSNKNFLAVCEEGDNAIISIYETCKIQNLDKPKRKKMLIMPDYIKKIDQLSFSKKNENKY